MAEHPAGRIDLPREVGFGDFLSLSWQLYVRSWSRLMILFLPAIVGIYLVPPVIGFGLRSVELGKGAESLAVLIAIALAVAVPTMLGSGLFAVAQVLMADGIAGQRRRISEAARQLRPLSKDLLQAALFATVLAAVLSLSGLVRLVGAVAWGPPVVGQVIALERRPFGVAWNRARRRLAGNSVRVILYLVVVALAVGAASVILFTPLAFVPLPEGPAGQLVAAGLRGLVGAITLPYLAAAMLVIHFDLRVRTEGFNREQLKEERVAAQ